MAQILIVDDDAQLRQSFGKILEGEGFEVRAAPSGEAGVEEVTAAPPDLVIMDVRMPGMTGIQAMQKMRAACPGLPVIIMTAYGGTETAIEATKLGAFDYILKPFDIPDILRLIGQALNAGRLARARVAIAPEDSQAVQEDALVGQSRAMQEVFKAIGRAAPTEALVLIRGESGTGKELVARAVHDASRRTAKPFITVNCGRLNANTAESELFGHVQGAFTGANKGRAGLFELANTGTLFMDEISEMPLDVQVKLLRVLETSTFRRLGGNHDISVDVRFVFASNKKLEECVNRGEFREDLFHRINLLPINVPPLRERPDDVIPLSYYFLKTATEGGAGGWEISEEAMAALTAYSWPGNVRELRNVIRRASILATEPIISSDLLPFSPPKNLPPPRATGSSAGEAPPLPLWVVERDHIQRVLDQVEGNKSRAAKLLEIDRKTLYTKLERYGLPT